jgi:small-conductance mechanosensitive channel
VDRATIINLVATGAVVIAAVVSRIAVSRWIGNRNWPTPQEGRRWRVRLQLTSFLISALLLTVIWATELRTAALSLVAVAVALVVATQDFIKSVLGSLMRVMAGSFTVGDRIRVGEIRGVVIDHSLLVTTLLEIGPGHVRTGRTVVIPNSKLLTELVFNETLGHEYILHSFTIPVHRAHWRAAEAALMAAAREQSTPYIERARSQMEQRSRKYSLPMPNVDPFVLPKPVDKDTVELTVRVPTAADDVWIVESAIIRSILEADD